MKRILFAVVALAACGLDAAAASMPSFNCARAFSPDEITICNSEELAALIRDGSSEGLADVA